MRPDTDRLEEAYKNGHAIATENAKAMRKRFFKLPEVGETIQVVTYVTAVGDVSTDLLS